MTVTREELEKEIEALQKQAQEAQLTIFKIEGALQFAYHLLSQVTAAEGEHKTVDAEVV